MVGKGVRYNAEKKKVGAYYSTAIYRFNMKCHLCPGRIVIETDPKECDYKLVSGAARKDERWDAENVGQVPLQDAEDALKLASDPMYRYQTIYIGMNPYIPVVCRRILRVFSLVDLCVVGVRYITMFGM